MRERKKKELFELFLEDHIFKGGGGEGGPFDNKNTLFKGSTVM